MANHVSSLKRARQTVDQDCGQPRQQEQAAWNPALAARGDRPGRRTPLATTHYRETVSMLDKSVQKGVLHKNTASRYKSRLNARVKAVAARRLPNRLRLGGLWLGGKRIRTTERSFGELDQKIGLDRGDRAGLFLLRNAVSAVVAPGVVRRGRCRGWEGLRCVLGAGSSELLRLASGWAARGWGVATLIVVGLARLRWAGAGLDRWLAGCGGLVGRVGAVWARDADAGVRAWATGRSWRMSADSVWLTQADGEFVFRGRRSGRV